MFRRLFSILLMLYVLVLVIPCMAVWAQDTTDYSIKVAPARKVFYTPEKELTFFIQVVDRQDNHIPGLTIGKELYANIDGTDMKNTTLTEDSANKLYKLKIPNISFFEGKHEINVDLIGTDGSKKSTNAVFETGKANLFNNVKKVSGCAALKNDGTVWTWGANYNGELGDGSSLDTERDYPLKVETLSNIVDISSGKGFILALSNDGSVWGWGSDADYKLANAAEQGTATRPVKIPGLSNIVSISAGGSQSLALDKEGKVYHWGAYEWPWIYIKSVECVPAITDAKQIAAGFNYSLVLKNDGTVWGWGVSNYGALGNTGASNGFMINKTNPVKAEIVTRIKSLSASGRYVLAVDENDEVWEWGDISESYQKVVTTPKKLSSLKNIVQVSSGGQTGGAVDGNGDLWVWGNNFYGQLGIGKRTFDAVEPVKSDISNVAFVSCSQSSVVAVEKSGSVMKVGDFAQLDDFSFEGSVDFVPIMTEYTANTAPSVTDYTVTTKEDVPVSGTVVGTDMNGDVLTYTIKTNPTNGTVKMSPDGAWMYNPNPDYSGTDSFTVEVSDGMGGTGISKITIAVDAVRPIICRIDSPALMSENIGLIKVYGWILDEKKVQKVEVVVDDNVIGEAIYGDLREDVLNAYPDYNNKNSGFHYILKSSLLTLGKHAIKILETRGNGMQYTVASRDFFVKLKPIGYIDIPQKMYNYSGKFNVTGWAMDEAPVEKVEVLVDDVLTGEATYGDNRPDVQNVYPQYGNNNSGYHYALDTAALSEGKHVLKIRVTSQNHQFVLSPREFTVSKLPVRCCIDYPKPNLQCSGTVNIRGWLLDSNGVKKIDVLVDNVKIGEAIYGTHRPDVQNAYPQYGSADCGFSFDLDTSKLSSGVHKLTISETGSQGGVTIFVSDINYPG